MQAEEAIGRWAAQYLKLPYEPDRFTVDHEYEEGFACCGGYNPDCYCSLAESGHSYIEIYDRVERRSHELQLSFSEVLKQVLEYSLTSS